MEDDIDIEEHDVMDNPRIKSIFPDLSRVKIEIPDDDDIDEEQYAPVLKTEAPQEMLYQSEYSFETTTDDVPREHEEGNTSYFYNNEIILGSKPPIDPEILYEEAKNSNPVVILENWDYKLKFSPCFCKTCETLFPTVNALDAHKMISHSYLIALDTSQKNTARKSTVTSKYCNHCSKTFPDDTSLIKHLYELLPLNKYPKVKEEKVEPEIKIQKKYTPLQLPKKIKSTSQVIAKIEPKEIKIEPVSKDKETRSKYKIKFSRDGKFFATSSLVPNSTLFQCNICQVGFLSCFSALQHSKTCQKLLNFKKCGVCKRKIRSKDFKIHELQHNYTDKLKIYTTNKSIYDRVLCKCPKCLSCLDEIGFWAHYQKCTKTEKKCIYCSDCDVHIATSRYQSHKLRHTQKKLTKKDFIVIEFHDHNNIKMIRENRIEAMRTQRLKDQIKKYREKKNNDSKSNDNDITLYYCETCGCCQYILNYKGHTDGSCNNNDNKKRYCEKCGLCFSIKSITSHLVLHEKRSFSLKDIKIVSLTTGKTIEPPMSEFFKCKKCDLHFIYRKNVYSHDCKTEKYITCKICTKKFNLQAYKIHKIFHSVDKLIPELMKKYNLINSTWNIMYMCKSCELVTMTYDAAVTHSQGHLNYIISDLHKQCVVCDLKIAEKEFSLHEKLHSNNKSIGRESFKILNYKYEDLFKKEWLHLFEDLPMEHRQQILSKSIYRYTRSVKMQIEISAPTDDTKYFCMNCNHFVEATIIDQHIKSKCPRNNKLVCNICHEIFKSLKQFLTHEGTHDETPKIQTIVTFNNEIDKEFNNHLSLIESKSRKAIKDVPLSKLRELLITDTVKMTYKLYKCAKCDTCVSLKTSIKKHHCTSDIDKVFCEICEEFFNRKKISVHREAHKKKPSVTKNSFHVVYFNVDDKNAKKLNKKVIMAKTPSKKVIVAKTPTKELSAKISPKKMVIAKIYKCECGLHFTNMKTVENHVDKCSLELDVSKETCSKCNLIFPTEVLVTHLVNHHHKETKIVIEKVVKVKLFKCPNCAVIFTNMANFNSHTGNCDPKIGIHCKNCRLTFSKMCFSKHLCSTENITYINKITVLRKTVKQVTVHRCEDCDICYLQPSSLRYHFDVNHRLKKTPTMCTFCGLKFTNCSYQKHIKFHSYRNADYKIKIFNPINRTYVFLTGNNNVNCDGNTDSNRSSPRKRKYDNSFEIDSALGKKVKKSLSEKEMKTYERKSIRNAIDKPSTSRDSRIEIDEIPTVINVSDEISDLTIENINDTDNDISELTSPVKINDSIAKKPSLSRKTKSRILVDRYSKNLFRCIYCNQHYMKEESFDYHIKAHKQNEENFTCEICHLDFSRHTLPRHKYVHHEYMGLKFEDFTILTETPVNPESELSKKFKKFGKNYLKTNNLDVSSENLSEICDSELIDIVSDTDLIVNDTDHNVSDTDHNVNDTDHNISDTDQIVNDTDHNVNDTDLIVNDTDNIVNDIEKICYYKCFDCNVCFVDQKMCHEHTLNHEILDPKTYIQCKICEFQFLIDSLKEHVNLHHSSDFMIENLTIHEYKASEFGVDPKIDIYQAIDKVQSKLVSTTTDVGIV